MGAESIVGLAGKYTISREVGGAFFATTALGHPALLIPVLSIRPPVDRASGDVIIAFHSNIDFKLADRSFSASAAVIECTNPRLASTFEVLSSDLTRTLERAGERPTPHEVSRALARWEELLRARRAMSREEEVGLWGELWMLLQIPDTSTAVEIWRGPEDEPIDFVGGGIGIECKASFRRLQHFVSQEQVTRPLGDLDVFFQSIWISQDPVDGETINDLISRLDLKLDRSAEFEEKLLKAGYSRADSLRYQLKLRVLEPPMLFPISAIPRVRAADPGVSHLRFLASLNDDKALTSSAALATTMRLCTAKSL